MACLDGWPMSGDAAFHYSHMILVIVEDEIPDGAPTPMEATVFETMREHNSEHGIGMLDMLLANPDKVRSMAFAMDPDCIWTQPFEP